MRLLCIGQFNDDSDDGEMNEHEELLAKALVCLNEASKIEDAMVRAKVLELVYQSQKVAQTAILRDFDGVRPNPSPESAPFAQANPPTNPKARV